MFKILMEKVDKIQEQVSNVKTEIEIKIQSKGNARNKIL